MRISFFLICSVFISGTVLAQDKFDTYPQTFVVNKDSFALRWGNTDIDKYKFASDTANFNSGAVKGSFFVVFYNNDSVVLKYKNKIPYGQYTYFNFIAKGEKKTIRLGFDSQSSIFTKEQIQQTTGKVLFDIPEVYELANIIWTLSPTGARAKDLNKQGSYYNKMVAHFKPYLNHPVFKALDFPDSTYFINYYDFRENSFAFNFQDPKPGSTNTRLLFNGPYYHIWGNELADSSLFGKLKPLVEDFAKKSQFRQFYKNNLATYQKDIEREKSLLPVKQMWSWLEQQFPTINYQSYRIVFSPLIGGSHSTQNFWSDNDGKDFRQTVMFICNADRVDTVTVFSEKQKEGVLSGVVFTEIDHNYVNRITNKYRKAIDSVFSNKSVWVKEGLSKNFYSGPVNIFNEYMTWSVFCLYVLDNYNKTDADIVINERETRMVDKRDFIRFREFNNALIKIRKENAALTVAELYPFIINWCRQQL
jgi:hypothetical protein